MAVFDFLKDKRGPDAAKAPTSILEAAKLQTEAAPRAKDAQESENRQLVALPASSIRPNPNQPRKAFDEEALEELADSIRQVGLIQPLVVRRVKDGGYELVAGERRLRACKLMGMQEIPCLLEESMVEKESAMIALIENLQRENLHYLEEAECYETLLETYRMTQEELALQLGKSQSTIANKLRVLRLSPAVKEAMTSARLTERHARTLLKLRDEPTQLSIIERVRTKSLSVKDTERLVEKTLNRLYDQKQDGAAPRPKILRYLRDYRLFVNSINMAAGQLREAGMQVDIEQTELAGGIDLVIRVRRNKEEQQ